jgi:ABC-type dipeptide/oligopeptide/nickel transport system permease subunit
MRLTCSPETSREELTITKRLLNALSYTRNLKRNKLSLLGLCIILAFAVLALFPNIFTIYSPNDVFSARLPPSAEHLFGTDTLGRDVYTMVIWGTRTTFYVGGSCVLIELIIGLVVGILSGYKGGWIDEILMRFTDIILALPTLVVLILAVSMFQARSLNVIIMVMGLIGWPYMARVIRSQVLSVKHAPYIDAAKVMGAKVYRIIVRHILPNIILPIVILMTIHFAGYVLWEATLTFLGLGDPSSLSWGILINNGKLVMRTAPWILIYPGIFLFLALVALQFLGDGLRDIFDIRV